MCGIFGFYKLTDFNNCLSMDELRKIIRYLAVANETRGRDSTGLAVVDAGADVFTLRKTKPAGEFIQTGIVRDSLLSAITPATKAVLGHTRSATTGEVTVKNAQPFTCGTVTGTHNGIVTNYAALFTRYTLKPETTCDSEVIFAMLAQSTTKQKRYLDAIEGFFSLAWYDTRTPDALNFARTANDLAVYKDTQNRFLLYSSTETPLKLCAEIFELTLEPLTFPVNTLISITKRGKLGRKQALAPKFTYLSYDDDYLTPSGYRVTKHNVTDYSYTNRYPKAAYVSNGRANDRPKSCPYCHRSEKIYWSSSFQQWLCNDCLSDLVSYANQTQGD